MNEIPHSHDNLERMVSSKYVDAFAKAANDHNTPKTMYMQFFFWPTQCVRFPQRFAINNRIVSCCNPPCESVFCCCCCKSTNQFMDGFFRSAMLVKYSDCLGFLLLLQSPIRDIKPLTFEHVQMVYICCYKKNSVFHYIYVCMSSLKSVCTLE